MATLVGTLVRESHEGGHSVWIFTEDWKGDRYWFCIYSTAEGNRGGSLKEDELSCDSHRTVVPWTPAASN